MNWIDWIVIGVFCTLIMGIGLLFAKRGSGSMSNFFLAGRKLPWWLAGFSMMATNFASDTPLHQSGNARREGIIGWWFYLRTVIPELSIAFFFARLWRRANILTDAEFFELRHGAVGGKFLRGTVASYNCFIYAPLKIGLFTLAMRKIAETVFQVPETVEILGFNISSNWLLCVGVVIFALAYSITSGLWGVVVTDFIEFFVALVATYVLLFLCFKAIGGPHVMVDRLEALYAEGRLSFNPTRFSPKTVFSPVLILLFLPHNWLYDGDLGVVQRLMACRSEKDSMLSQLMRTILNFVVRSWPWILCGMASLILLAEAQVENDYDAYPMLMRMLMPNGLMGLMMVSFLAAFLSSADTYLNLGSAYFMNDIYRRFLVKNKHEHHYVAVSRVAVLVLAIIGIMIAGMSEDIFELFKLMLKLMAAAKIIRVLRWFWWRVNGWAEVTALVTGTVVTIIFSLMKAAYFTQERLSQIRQGIIPDSGIRPPAQWVIDIFHIKESFLPNFLYFVVDFTLITLIATITWLIVMLLTKPDPVDSLKEFYRRVRPAGPGWKPIAKLCPEVRITDSLLADTLAWIVGCVFCYSAIFAVGALYFCRWKLLSILLIIAIISGSLLKFKLLTRYEVVSPVVEN